LKNRALERYPQLYTSKHLFVSIVLSLFGRRANVNRIVMKEQEKDVSIDDLISGGFLFSTQEELVDEDTIDVETFTPPIIGSLIPMVSMVQLRSWCDIDSHGQFSQALKNLLTFYNASYEAFEEMTIRWEIVMRHVRAEVMKQNLSESVDWRNATLLQIYGSKLPSSQLSPSLSPFFIKATFDVTSLLSPNPYLFSDLKELKPSVDNIPTLISHIFYPKKLNNPGFDSLIFLTHEDILVPVAFENKFSRDTSTTQLTLSEHIEDKRTKTITAFEISGIPTQNLFFIIMALRPLPQSYQQESLPPNTLVLDRASFSDLVGPSLWFMMQYSSSMDLRANSVSIDLLR